ncbi:MAG: hypothetical protein MR004_09700 [Clostridiales bacterium]|nr:hypothetical protein [bacterium 210917-SL.2.15]MCI5843898.1 hypothetical protein [Clostridiales bacterium]MDY4035839.1 hypothetical protein [Candidatus Pseudoscilispira sp.]
MGKKFEAQFDFVLPTERKRLPAYSRRDPAICQQTNANSKMGCWDLTLRKTASLSV